MALTSAVVRCGSCADDFLNFRLTHFENTLEEILPSKSVKVLFHLFDGAP